MTVDLFGSRISLCERIGTLQTCGQFAVMDYVSDGIFSVQRSTKPFSSIRHKQFTEFQPPGVVYSCCSCFNFWEKLLKASPSRDVRHYSGLIAHVY